MFVYKYCGSGLSQNLVIAKIKLFARIAIHVPVYNCILSSRNNTIYIEKYF